LGGDVAEELSELRLLEEFVHGVEGAV